uniref:Uncharacterized protein n=1 Tax=Romanomermis culicivorax TaxID=13658 RepID=A0A915JZ98_ROMCU
WTFIVTSNDILNELCPASWSRASFDLHGCGWDLLSRMDPEIHIYHKCHSNDIKKIDIPISQSALGTDHDLGSIDLTYGHFVKEKTVRKFPVSSKCETNGVFITRKECVTVKGNLTCISEVPIYVQLTDSDLVQHDIMDEVCPVTRSFESFKLHGCSRDLFSRIDPEVHIYHRCKDNELRKIEMIVPQSALGSEYNLGRLDLNSPFNNEQVVSKLPSFERCGGTIQRLWKKLSN